ncbi:golgin subfamily A member 6-like protein 26 [Paramacrobiotus metropolitanus]|uniref:golgin subfamily A member 6-like protein 26 n=1 Tax=Paramacrobiotus metropolitanus TaxID=2943436 RepID=UPI0024464DAD|nr:golgin subfamily A member 6-like protein 26 [Paramacrobiotus metropolitanus]
MNQTKVTGEDKPTERGAEPVGASQLDATTSGKTEQDKNVNLIQVENRNTKVTEENLAELGLDDLSLIDKTAGDDLWATPMVSDESNESYFTDDEATMNMSFQTAMKEADRAEGMTPFKDIPEHLIERTTTGKVINVRPPSPNSPTLTLKRRVKELEEELEAKEGLVTKRKQEYQNRIGSLDARIFELEQQQADLESVADEWKIKYERQKELAEEYLKMVDDREMEGHLAVSELNESMSEESAERSRHLAELKDECDLLKLKVTEAETKRDEYATKLADATQRLLTNTTEVFKLRNDLKLRDESIGTLQKESYDHQRRADEAAKVAKDLRDLTATEGVRLNNEIRQVMQENKVLKEDNKKVTDEIKELKEAAKTIAEQGAMWEHEAHLLDEKVTVLELKDKEWQQTVHQKTQEIIRLNTELIDMTQTAMTREDEVTRTKNQLKAAAEEYTTLERDVTQLAEHIKRMENDTEKVIQEKTFQLHQHMLKVNEENQNLKTEKEEFQLKVRRLEDENKALNMSNKHKNEQLLQYGVRTATVESPPPSYRSVKAEREGEKGKEDKEPPSESNPHMSRGDPSQFPSHFETNVFMDEGRRDRPSSRQERPRKSRYGKAKRNQNNDESSEEEEDQRAEDTTAQLTKALNSMARKNTLVTFDGSRDAVNGWTQLVRDTQRTYHLTDDQILIEIASAVKGPAKTWFEGEREIALQEETEYTITEWMAKFKDEYGDRDEEVLGLREAMEVLEKERSKSVGDLKGQETLPQEEKKTAEPKSAGSSSRSLAKLRIDETATADPTDSTSSQKSSDTPAKEATDYTLGPALDVNNRTWKEVQNTLQMVREGELLGPELKRQVAENSKGRSSLNMTERVLKRAYKEGKLGCKYNKDNKVIYYLPEQGRERTPRLPMVLEAWKIAIKDVALDAIGGTNGASWGDLSNFMAVHYELGELNIEKDKEWIKNAVEALIADEAVHINSDGRIDFPPLPPPEKEAE